MAVAGSFEQRVANSSAQIDETAGARGRGLEQRLAVGEGLSSTSDPLFPSYHVPSVQAEAKGRGRKSRGYEHGSLVWLPTYSALLQHQFCYTVLL